MASVEHIHPQSKGGVDAMYNFGGADTRVNAERGNIDFTEQIERVPETKENTQKYFNGLVKLLKNGIFRKNNIKTNYIDNFSRTIYQESCGKINLDTSELIEHRQKSIALLNILKSLNLQ